MLRSIDFEISVDVTAWRILKRALRAPCRVCGEPMLRGQGIVEHDGKVHQTCWEAEGHKAFWRPEPAQPEREVE